MKIKVLSEVSRLKKVLVHEPGKEIELVSPREVKEQHFIDIVHYEGAKRAHKQLRSVLEKAGVSVRLLEQELVKALSKQEIRDYLITRTVSEHGAKLYDTLNSMDSVELATVLLRGLTSNPVTLTDYLVNRRYSIAPLPNLIFVRDIAMIYNDKVITGSMAKITRQRETSIIKAVLKGNFGFTDSRILLDGAKLSKNEDIDFRIEGGDFHVLNQYTLAIGLSERTSSLAIDSLIDNIVKTESLEKDLNVIVVPLPKFKSMIHLDMVFSMVSYNEAVVFPPVTMRTSGKGIIRIEVSPRGDKKFYEYDNIVEALASAGIDIEPIFCANGEAIYQQREQWSSGCNFFTFAPAKILGYSFNLKTLEALNKRDYEVISADTLLEKDLNIEDYKKLVVTIEGNEIARGSGGSRCMTMPLEREE